MQLFKCVVSDFLRLTMTNKVVAKMNLKVYFCNIMKASSTTIPTISTTTSPNTLKVTFYQFYYFLPATSLTMSSMAL